MEDISFMDFELKMCNFIDLLLSLQGDSGGPFVCQLPGQEEWKLFGVTSWRYHCPDPTAFVQIVNYIDWIKNILDQ